MSKNYSKLSYIFRMTALIIGHLILVTLLYGVKPDGSKATSHHEQKVSSVMQSEQQDTASPSKHLHTNDLIHETSPYLLQHAHNPVNWHSWKKETLEKARREDKPIFLSVGYSTCYWCHVMEKQSFEDEEVAAILNQHFIAIKVDREERPDIDEQFMLATQLISGRGGWPNSVWLTPEGKPWWAGTYFPKIQFMDILNQLAVFWKENRSQVETQATQMMQAIQNISNHNVSRETSKDTETKDLLTEDIITKALQDYERSFDSVHGGFGRAPKFPPHGNLSVLSHLLHQSKNEKSLRMVTHTLDAMWLGGVHDHLGGGFHRYSTDAFWLLPHFEKMLYDNAQLMKAYTDGFLLTGDTLYRNAVEDIFTWLEREMTSPEGGFYSALDSGEVGREGEYYLWHHHEILNLLGEKNGSLFADTYSIKPEGNFKEESSGEKTGSNIAHLSKRLSDAPDHISHLSDMREKLLLHRKTRTPPHRDDKILTSWNGLMIESLAYGGKHLGEPKYLSMAKRSAEFVLNRLIDDQGYLLRTHRSNVSHLPGVLEDYAYFSKGLLALYESTQDQTWLNHALRLTELMLSEFEDKAEGGFFSTATSRHDSALSRVKSIYGGGNIPNASGIAIQVLLNLSALTQHVTFFQSAERALKSVSRLITKEPGAFDACVQALSIFLEMKDSFQTNDKKPPLTLSENPVSVEIFSSQDEVAPGKSWRVAVSIRIEKLWHLYGDNPELDFLMPVTVNMQPHAHAVSHMIKKTRPYPKDDPVLAKKVFVYEGKIWFLFEASILPDAPEGHTQLTFNVKSQACDQSRCLTPREHILHIPIAVKSNAKDTPSKHDSLFPFLEETLAS